MLTPSSASSIFDTMLAQTYILCNTHRERQKVKKRPFLNDSCEKRHSVLTMPFIAWSLEKPTTTGGFQVAYCIDGEISSWEVLSEKSFSLNVLS